MKLSGHAENLLQYTKVAASTLEDIANSTGVSFLGSIATLTSTILKGIEVRATLFVGAGIRLTPTTTRRSHRIEMTAFKWWNIFTKSSAP
jgi:hypothetical protein